MKKFKKLLVFVLASFMFIPNVSALTLVLEDGEISYAIDNVPLTCEHFDGTENFFGIDKERNQVFEIGGNGDLYSVNSEGCRKLDVQGILDMYNNLPRRVEDIYIDGDKVIIKIIEGYNFMSYIKANPNYDATKTYYQFIQEVNYSYYEEVTSPNENDVSNYYEKVYFRMSKTVERETGAKYYEENGEEHVEVSQYDSNKVLEYGVLIDENEAYSYIEKPFDSNLIDSGLIYDIVYDMFNEKLYFNGESEDDPNIIGVYTEDGTFHRDIRVLEVVGNGLLLVSIPDGLALANEELEILTDDDYDLEIFPIEIKEYVSLVFAPDLNEGIFNIFKYMLIEGKNQTFTGKEDLKFKFSAPLDRASKVYVDGKVLTEEQMTLESGSTIVTLKSDYLKTLENKAHTLKIEYVDGASNTVEFTTAYNPQTGDNIMTIFIIAGMSLIIMGGLFIYLKKEKINS